MGNFPIVTGCCLPLFQPPRRAGSNQHGPIKDSFPPLFSAGILEQSLQARNLVGIGLSYWPARLHRLAELVPWNRFLLLKSLRIPSLVNQSII